jgi:hypothetical protein
VAWGLVVVLAGLLCLRQSVAAQGQAQGPFADVPADHPALDAVNELASWGLITGYPDGSYNGDRRLNRYEFAVAVQRLTELPFRLDFVRPKPPVKPRVRLPILAPPFRDVPEGHWASGAVEWLREQGIVAGYLDGTFRGTQRMKHSEVALVTQRLRDHFVGMFGHEPRQRSVPLRLGPVVTRDHSMSRYESAANLRQAVAFYQAVIEASVE